MKIVYMGTPEMAARVLEEIVKEPVSVAAVFTQPDRKVGRKQILTPSPVKEAALRHGIEVYQPYKLRNPKWVRILREIQPDLILVTAYGQILSQEILDIPPLGCINFHASLLPKYRGAAPVQSCIANGETRTGVTAMQMDAGLDTGDMLLKEEVAIAPDETYESLSDKLSEAACRASHRVLEALLKGETLTRVPQNEEEATYVPMIRKEDGLVHFSESAVQIERKIRAYLTWPGCYTFLNGTKVALLKAAVYPQTEAREAPCGSIDQTLLEGRHPRLVVQTGDGKLEILRLQAQGRKAMDAEAFLRGQRQIPAAFEERA